MRLKLKVMRYETAGVVQRLIQENDGKRRRRLQVIDLAFSGEYTTEEIAEKVGCSRASVTNWVRLYEEGGTRSLMQTRYRPRVIPPLDKRVLDNVIHHISYALIPSTVKGMQRWLKDHYDVDLTLSGAKYWWGELWATVNQWDYDYPKNPPEVVLPYYGDDADW
jgi:transposase